MSAHSNRSPSPLSSKSTNPNLRNSENNSGNRRSFGGNKPFSKPSVLTNSRRFDSVTPANSPSDFASGRSMIEEKENCEKEDMLKASKLQSPVKGCKHFMAPTISAASKFTPSPRKKVLVERNDPVRTSISLSDGKAMFFSSISSNVSDHFDSKSETGSQNQKIEGLLDSKVADSEKTKAVHPPSKPSKRVSFSDVPAEYLFKSESVITDSELDSVVTDSDSLKLDSSSKSRDDSPCIAPLDADPSLPPYDPKSNYLSPRPQFLLYKPNPRIEILLNKEKGQDPEGFKSLQDNLMEEIMSDSSEGSEESQTEDSSSQNEEIEVIDDGMVIGMNEMDADNHVSEPAESLPISTSINDVEDLVEKNGKKPRGLFRVMCFSTLLVLFFVACVSVSSITYSPHEFVQTDLILSDLSNLYHQSRAAAAAKVKFDRFSALVDELKTSTVSYLSEIANGLGKGGKQAPIQFVNLSNLHVENTWSEGFFLNKATTEGLMENLEEDEMDAEMDTFEEEEGLMENLEEDEMDTFEEEEYEEEIVSDEKEYGPQDDVILVAETDTFGEEEEAYETFEKGLKAEEETSTDGLDSTKYSQDTQIQREAIDTKPLDEQKTIDQSASGVEDPLEVATDPASSVLLDHKSESDVNTLSEGVQSSSEDNSIAHIAMGVSSILVGLLAAAAFMYKRKQQPCSAPLLNKEMTPKHYIRHEKEQTEVDDVCPSEMSSSLQRVDDVCPSEMSSSFQKRTASYSSKKGGATEALSSERNASRKTYRRESLASSSGFSTESPSYGSFTTYEKIPIKHGNVVEDEIMTPVRRSSRIRKQVTSP